MHFKMLGLGNSIKRYESSIKFINFCNISLYILTYRIKRSKNDYILHKATITNPYFEIFEALPFPCLLLEPLGEEFVVRDANKKFCELSGKNLAQLKGQIYPEMILNEDVSRQNLQSRQLSLQKVIKSGAPHKIESLRLDLSPSQKEENNIRFWSVENIPIKDKNGEVIYILNMAVDQTSEILEKEKIIQRLAAKEQQQDHFIGKNQDGIYSLDAQGNFLHLNEGLAKMAEMPREEILNKSFLPFCAPYEKERVLESFHRAISGSNESIEAEFISAKGNHLILEISLFPMNEKNQRGVYGIAKNLTLLRQQERELYRNQKKFQALVQEGNDLVAIIGTDGIYSFVSNTTENILGYKPSFLDGKSAFDFIHPEDKERVLGEFSELEGKKHVRINNFRFKDATGKWRWIETFASNFIDDPYVEGIVVNSRDITALVEQSRQIKQIYERYTLAAEATEDLIYDWNLETDEVTRFHKGNEDFLGYSREEIDNREFWKGNIHPVELPHLKQTLKDSLDDPEKTSLKTQYRFQRADGSYAQIIDRANIVRNEKGEAIRLIGATSDVSKLVENKTALKLANKRFSYAMKATKEMIWDWNIEQAYIKRSGAFKRIFGYNTPKDASVENVWFDKIVEEDKERIKKSLDDALHDPDIKKWREEYCFVKKDGTLAYVVDRGFILREKNGTAIRMVGAVLDVTESRRMLREIQKQNEILKEVAWEQAHIVRAPLARLKGLLDLLEQEEFDEWSREELLGLIRTSADEVDNVIGKIIRKTEGIEG